MTADAARTFGTRYRAIRMLGRGGMGAVYVAEDTNIGRRVAIKALHDELALDATQIAWLRDEAFSLASLQHPNIVQLYDFQAGGPEGAFLVMELVEGETLEARLARDQVLPVDVAIDFAKETLSALAAAHARGIIHRDIKPANLLLQRMPLGGEIVKVLDFGIAKLRDEERQRPQTTVGTVLGTPSHMSPEQATGSLVDARSDLHAVALCLFRMLTGQNPFEGRDRLETVRRVIQLEPPRVDALRPSVPAHVADAVQRALAKSPTARFADAGAFARALGATPPRAQVDAVLAPTLPDVPANVGEETAAPRRPPPSAPQARGERSSSAPAVTGRGGGSSRVFFASLGGSVLLLLLLGAAAALGFGLARRSNVATADAATGDDAATASSLAAAEDAGSSALAEDAAAAEPEAVTAAASDDAAAGRAARPATGHCSCTPFSQHANQFHGSTMRLAPRSHMTIKCDCKNHETGMKVCSGATLSSCTPFFISADRFGTACSGIDTWTHEPATGVFDDCYFDTPDVDVYGGPAGAPCSGHTVDNRVVQGRVTCFGR